ncbi:MAG: 4-hydroxy-tetrahydrodipicolinate synthase [Actinomycetota bacterium]|nr:4-hydroxy-tetrahydrodipicolinate synthase [Actinomycetota bacterium]
MSAPLAPFGHVLTAMVTPFTPDGDLDLARAAELADRLVSRGNNGLVVSGTTGEAPTTTDREKSDLLRAVVDAVGGRAQVLAGVGTYDTRGSVELAREAEKAGAQGLLVVTPYYSKPPQAGIIAHLRGVADATALPVMLYDIPGRTGTALETDTLVELSAHPQIVAVKDAKDDLQATAELLSRCDLAVYSGTDALNLPLLALGAVGVVSVVSHVVTEQIVSLVAAHHAGDAATARTINRALQPVYTGIFRSQGAIMTKAALDLLGFPVGPLRLPLVEATAVERALLRQDLAEAGLLPPS